MRIEGKEVVLDATFVTRVSLAAALTDSFTKGQPIGRVRVLLEELSREGILNPSGYFLFLNIPDGSYTLRVESENYLDEELSLSIPSSPPENPLLSVFLNPRPSYPFPPGATLIRGLARDATDRPVTDALIEVAGKNIANRSQENGDFVLFYSGLKENDIIKENGKKFVKGNGTKTVTLRANSSTHGTQTVAITEGVEESQTTSVTITF